MRGTMFIDRHIRANVPSQQKTVFLHQPAVAVLGIEQPSTEVTADTSRIKTRALKDLLTSRKIRLVKTITVPALTKVTVGVFTLASGLGLVYNHPRTAIIHLTLIAQGVIKVRHHRPFPVCVSSFGDKPIHLPKHTVFGTVLPSSAYIVTAGSASLGVADVKAREKKEHEDTPSTYNTETWADEIHVSLDDFDVWWEDLQLLEEL